MKKELTNLINWSDVDEIVQSRSAQPSSILGRHIKDGVDILQAYLPDAKKVTVTFKGKKSLEMVCVSQEKNWFVCELDRSYKGVYFYTISYESGEPVTVYDPYQFATQITEADLKRFEQGIH